MKVPTPPAAIYQELVAAERRYPVRAFRTDLTVHDRRALSSLPPGATFLWVLYRDGTLFIRPGSTLNLPELPRTLEDLHWFFWDGSRLVELPDAATAISRYAQEVDRAGLAA